MFIESDVRYVCRGNTGGARRTFQLGWLAVRLWPAFGRATRCVVAELFGAPSSAVVTCATAKVKHDASNMNGFIRLLPTVRQYQTLLYSPLFSLLISNSDRNEAMRNSTVPGAGLRRVMGADVAAFVSEIGIGPKPRSAELIGRMASAAGLPLFLAREWPAIGHCDKQKHP